MTENRPLLKRREELKFLLDEGKYQTPVDSMLDWVNYPFRKVMGNNHTLSAIYGTLVICILTMLIGLIFVSLWGEIGIFQQLALRFGWWMIPLLATSTISMTTANAFSHRIIAIFRDHILEIAETVDTLDDIKRWVNLISSKKLALVAGVVGGFVTGATSVFNLTITLGFFIGIGFTIMIILFAIQSSLFIGFLFIILFLTIQMRRYQLALFPSDPANSQFISTMSGFLSNFVYLFAVYGALLTFIITASGLLITVYSIFPIFWGLIVLIFSINQYSLAEIIQRAKWKTLNSIQSEIEKIQKKRAVLNNEQRETLIWLLNYHDRVKATRNSALNWEAGFSLLNSLLLPVLAFVLGNLESIIAFFR